MDRSLNRWTLALTASLVLVTGTTAGAQAGSKFGGISQEPDRVLSSGRDGDVILIDGTGRAVKIDDTFHRRPLSGMRHQVDHPDFHPRRQWGHGRGGRQLRDDRFSRRH